MNSPQETQLSHDLHQLASGGSYTSDLAEIKQLARQRQRRDLRRRGATVAGAVVLAAGGLFVGVHGFSGDHGTTDTAVGSAASTGASTTPSQSATVGATPRLETVAYVANQVEAALASVNGDIIREDEVQSGSRIERGTTWTDSSTGNLYGTQFGTEFASLTDKTIGKSSSWQSTRQVAGGISVTEVDADYANRTWYSSTMLFPAKAEGSSLNGVDALMTPAEIKSWAASGKLKIVGHQSINGQDTVILRDPWDAGYRKLWVDSQTFLPVRIFVDFDANIGGVDTKLTGNLTWLPRTDSLVNTVNKVHIPAGFKQVPAPQ
jgi:hypothetical protein